MEVCCDELGESPKITSCWSFLPDAHHQWSLTSIIPFPFFPFLLSWRIINIICNSYRTQWSIWSIANSLETVIDHWNLQKLQGSDVCWSVCFYHFHLHPRSAVTVDTGLVQHDVFSPKLLPAGKESFVLHVPPVMCIWISSSLYRCLNVGKHGSLAASARLKSHSAVNAESFLVSGVPSLLHLSHSVIILTFKV